jgi:hypothetical protein
MTWKDANCGSSRRGETSIQAYFREILEGVLEGHE